MAPQEYLRFCYFQSIKYFLKYRTPNYMFLNSIVKNIIFKSALEKKYNLKKLRFRVLGKRFILKMYDCKTAHFECINVLKLI
jgi:hypothetical protein